MLSRHSIRIALLALWIPCIVGAQEHPDLLSIGNGARAVGLGFANTAVVNDIHSIGWNPAGLTYLSRGEVAIVGRFVMMATSASATDYNPVGYPILSGNGEITGALDPIEFLGVAKPYRVGGHPVVAGIAWRRFAEGVRAGTFETQRRQANGRYFGSTNFSSRGGIRAISPSVAFEATSRVRLGVTANLLSGSTDYSVRGPFPYEYEARELQYSGVAFDVGALVALREGVRLGLHATLPHDRKLSFDNDTATREVTRRAPLAVAVGVAYDLDRRSFVSADLRYAPWASAEFRDDASGDSVDSDVGVNNGGSIHFGYERDVTTDIRRAKIRFGLFARRTTTQDLRGKAISSFGFSGGQSWYFSRGSFDLGLLYSRSTRWTRTQTPELRMDLTSHDVVLAMGLRRHF